MKRAFGLLLALPLAIAGCSEEEAADAAASFTSSYRLGTQVVRTGKIVSQTKTFVELAGTTTQVDNLAPAATTSAASGVCQILPSGRKTEAFTEVTGTSIVRVVGHQGAFLIPGTYYPSNNDEVNGGGVHTWGNPVWGDIFFTKPELDIWISEQSAAECNCDLDNYIKPVSIDLWLFENDRNYTEKTTTTTTQTTPLLTDVQNGNNQTGGSVVNDIDGSTLALNRSQTTFARFNLEGYIWETGTLTNLYSNGSLNYTANMILPDSVQVGDTWLDDNGNLVAAVGIEAVDAGDKKVRALHVVYRGHTDVDDTAAGVTGWCTDFFESQRTDAAGVITVEKDVELTDDCGADQTATGWINKRHVWYYRGLPVKIQDERVDVNILDYGFAAAPVNPLPAGANSNPPGALQAGEVACDLWSRTTGGYVAPQGTVDEIGRLQTYVRYEVSHVTETWEAQEVREGYTVVAEHREELKEEAAAE